MPDLNHVSKVIEQRIAFLQGQGLGRGGVWAGVGSWHKIETTSCMSVRFKLSDVHIHFGVEA